MSYLIVSDFKEGLDRRRSIITAPAGTLWTAKNVHITRGGEIEVRKAFKPVFALSPGNTFGLAVQASGLTTFGSAAGVGVPSGITYQRLVHPAGVAMTGYVASCLFKGKLYVLATFADGRTLHFYDGAHITDWYTSGPYAAYTARDCITYRSKVIVAADSSLVFSALNAPTDFHTSLNGAGAIDVSTNSQGFETLLALSKYQGYLAVYARRTMQTWSIDVDLSKCAFVDAAEGNMGVLAPRSVVPVGNIDNFMLNDMGIRSIRARDQSNRPGLYDIGTPIDTIIQANMATLGDTASGRAVGVLDPVDGRYLLSVGAEIYVFSYFATAKISAWTTYTTTQPITHWAVLGVSLYARSGDNILLYGGTTGAEYEACGVDVELPYLDAGRPATIKNITGIDAAIWAASDPWQVSIGLNPSLPATREAVANLYQPTFPEPRMDAMGNGTHMGLRLTHTGIGPAKVGNLVIHYDAPKQAD